MTVTHGMDPARVRQIGDQLRVEAGRAQEVAATGTAGMSILQGAWEGPDLESFAESWHDARPSLEAASKSLTTFAGQLIEQVESQETTSESGGGGSGGGGSTGGGGGGQGTGKGPWDTVQDILGGLGFTSDRLGDLAGIAAGVGMWKFGQFNPRGYLPNGRHGFLGHKPGSPFSKLPWHQRAALYGKDSSWIPKGGTQRRPQRRRLRQVEQGRPGLRPDRCRRLRRPRRSRPVGRGHERPVDRHR